MLNIDNLEVGMTIEIDDCYNASRDGSGRIEGVIVKLGKFNISLSIERIGTVYIGYKQIDSLNPQITSIQKD